MFTSFITSMLYVQWGELPELRRLMKKVLVLLVILVNISLL